MGHDENEEEVHASLENYEEPVEYDHGVERVPSPSLIEYRCKNEIDMDEEGNPIYCDELIGEGEQLCHFCMHGYHSAWNNRSD